MAPCMMSRTSLWRIVRGTHCAVVVPAHLARIARPGVVASEIRAIWDEREADPGDFEGGR